MMIAHVGLSEDQKTLLHHIDTQRYFGTRHVLVFDCMDAPCIERAFHVTADIYVDFKAIAQHQLDAILPVSDSPNDFMQFIVQTRTAYQLPVATEVAQHLAARYHLPHEKLFHIKTALHEAVTNAIIHGNLGMSFDQHGPKNLDDYYRDLNRRIHDPEHAARLVSITCNAGEGQLSIMVSDQGEGFDDAPVHTDYMQDKMSGNGRYLMHHFSDAVRYHNGGASVELVFKWQEACTSMK